MHTTVQLLDAAKARLGVTDYRLSKLLEVSTSAIPNYRAGRSVLNTEVAIRLADLLADSLGMDQRESRAYVVACAEWERAQRAGNEQEEAMWELVAGKFTAAAKKLATQAKAAAVLIAVGLFSLLFSGTPDGGAMASELAPSPSVQAAQGPCVHYVKRLVTYCISLLRALRKTICLHPIAVSLG